MAGMEGFESRSATPPQSATFGFRLPALRTADMAVLTPNVHSEA
jgi:hypothetical protein